MSDYDELGQLLIVGSVIAVVTLPIWAPVYGVWYICGGYKKIRQEKIKDQLRREEEQKRVEEYRKNYVPPKPIVYVSQTQKKKFN